MGFIRKDRHQWICECQIQHEFLSSIGLTQNITRFLSLLLVFSLGLPTFLPCILTLLRPSMVRSLMSSRPNSALVCFNIIRHQSIGMPEIKDPVVNDRVCPEWSGISLGHLKTADQVEFFRSSL
jgi:hypothetical protein